MTGAFLDTGLFVALAFTDDRNHQRADVLFRELLRGLHGKPLQICTAVIIETIALIHCKTRGNGKELRASRKVETIFSIIEKYKIEIRSLTPEIFDESKKIYLQNQGSLDLVDSVNVATIRTYGAQQIVSFDCDYDRFVTEGLTRLY